MNYITLQNIIYVRIYKIYNIILAKPQYWKSNTNSMNYIRNVFNYIYPIQSAEIQKESNILLILYSFYITTKFIY